MQEQPAKPLQFSLKSLFVATVAVALSASLFRWRFWPGWHEVAWPMLKGAMLWTAALSAGYLCLEAVRWSVRSFLRNPWDS
jgi:hypothetical protein